MPNIQVLLDVEENKIVEIYKASNGLKTKEEAVKLIIREYERTVKLGSGSSQCDTDINDRAHHQNHR